MKALLLISILVFLSSCGIQGQINNLKHDRDVQAGLNEAEQDQINVLSNANATLGATITTLLAQQAALQANQVNTLALRNTITSLQAQQTIMQRQIARLIAINRNY